MPARPARSWRSSPSGSRTRSCPVHAIAALCVVAASVGSAELLKHGLPRVSGALPAGRLPSFPSGHASVAVSLGMALVLVAPPLLRSTAALAGATYAAVVGVALVALGWHYPSDVLASFLLSGVWGSLAAATVSRSSRPRPGVVRGDLVIAACVAATGLAAVAVLGVAHSAVVGAVRSRETLVAMALSTGLISLATFAPVAWLAERRQL
jgi:hypothetical protein